MKLLLHPWREAYKPGSNRAYETAFVAKHHGYQLCNADTSVDLSEVSCVALMGCNMRDANKQGLELFAKLDEASMPIVWFMLDPDYSAVPDELKHWQDRLTVLHAYSDYEGMGKSVTGTGNWWPSRKRAKYTDVWWAWCRARAMPICADPKPGLCYIGYWRSKYRTERLQVFSPEHRYGHSQETFVDPGYAIMLMSQYEANIVVGDPAYVHLRDRGLRLLMGWASSSLTFVDSELYGECPYPGLHKLWVSDRDQLDAVLASMTKAEKLRLIGLQHSYLNAGIVEF